MNGEILKLRYTRHVISAISFIIPQKSDIIIVLLLMKVKINRLISVVTGAVFVKNNNNIKRGSFHRLLVFFATGRFDGSM